MPTPCLRPWIASLVALVAAGCSSGGAGGPGPESAHCVAGTVEACACDGAPGLRACGADGAFAACGCDDLSVPEAVDFGPVGPGTSREMTLAVSYRGAADLPIASVRLERGEPFRIVAAPERVPADGATVLFVLALDATGFGPYADTLEIRLGVEGYPALAVPLAGGSSFSCDAAALDFGELEAGLSRALTLRCTERVGVVMVEGPDADRFDARRLEEDPGNPTSVRVTHRADGEGPRAATLVIRPAGAAAAYRLPLRATDVYLRCGLVFAPPPIRLRAGERKTAQLLVWVQGNEDCAVRAIRRGEACDPGFEFAPWPASLVVRYAEPVSLPFEFGTDRDGRFRCPVSFEVADEAVPVREVELLAHVGWDACLQLQNGQPYLEGRASSCGGSGALSVYNACPSPLEVAGVTIEAPPSFALAAVPDVPFVLEPGARTTVGLSYRPTVSGREEAAVVFHGPGGERSSFPALGVAEERLTRTDAWHVGPMPQLDVLAVVDNGAGMAEEEGRVLAALGALPNLLRGRFDYHLAVTTSSLAPSPLCPNPAGGGERGRFVPVDGARPRVVTPEMPAAREIWEENLRVGACHDGPAEAMEAMRLALTAPLSDSADDPGTPEPADGNAGFLRSGSYLWVVFVGDRDDASAGTDLDYVRTLQLLKGFRADPRWRVSAVAGEVETGCVGEGGEAAAPATRWLDLVSRAPGGSHASICAVEAPLEVPVDRHRCFYLFGTAADFDGDGALTDGAGELEVRVNGSAVPSGEGTVWSATVDSLCFAAGHEPPWESDVEVEYGTCR